MIAQSIRRPWFHNLSLWPLCAARHDGIVMKQDRPHSDPEKAARRIMEHARAFERIQDGRNYIEKINAR